MANETDCCRLVGNLQLGLDGCIISISVNSRAEIIKECGGEILIGPSLGQVSVSAYAAEIIHNGCPGRAGVSVPWVRRYDCDTNNVYMIRQGQGSSYIAGEVDTNLISFPANYPEGTGRSFSSINASSQSGPASVYMETEQVEGYGLVYSGPPLEFDTSDDSLVVANFGVGEGDMYLQNFSVEFNPGELPTCSYSFAFVMSD